MADGQRQENQKRQASAQQPGKHENRHLKHLSGMQAALRTGNGLS